MQIALNLKGYGETKLIVYPLSVLVGEDKQETYVLVYAKEDLDNPFMTLALDEKKGKFEVISQHDVQEDYETLMNKLDDLALRVIEANQHGVDLSDVTLSKKGLEKPYNPDQIRVESKTFSIRLIYDMINSGDLDLSPDFQRNVVWDGFRKSRLIESILLRIPLPMFYFSQDEEGKLFVVDGLQRLTAIKEFMDNKLVLKGLEYLSNSCDDKTYSLVGRKIEDKYFRWFNMTQLSVNVIDPQSPAKVKYDIFKRLNTGGRPLNAQELRNCLSRNQIRLTLKKLAHSDAFLKATGNSISDVRMDAQELVLRFLYFRFQYKKGALDKYDGNMDEELNLFIELLNSELDFNFDEYERAFENAMNIAYYLFGRHAFRKVNSNTSYYGARSIVNKALFVSWAVVLSDLDINVIKGKFEANCLVPVLGKYIDNDDNYFKALSYGTNGKANILKAFEIAQIIINL